MQSCCCVRVHCSISEGLKDEVFHSMTARFQDLWPQTNTKSKFLHSLTVGMSCSRRNTVLFFLKSNTVPFTEAMGQHLRSFVIRSHAVLWISVVLQSTSETFSWQPFQTSPTCSVFISLCCHIYFFIYSLLYFWALSTPGKTGCCPELFPHVNNLFLAVAHWSPSTCMWYILPSFPDWRGIWGFF